MNKIATPQNKQSGTVGGSSMPLIPLKKVGRRKRQLLIMFPSPVPAEKEETFVKAVTRMAG